MRFTYTWHCAAGLPLPLLYSCYCTLPCAAPTTAEPGGLPNNHDCCHTGARSAPSGYCSHPGGLQEHCASLKRTPNTTLPSPSPLGSSASCPPPAPLVHTPLVHKHPPAHCQATQQLVAQALCLCHCAQTPVGHLLCIQLNGVLGEVEALLHCRGQLANAAALLTCTGKQQQEKAGSSKGSKVSGYCMTRGKTKHQ